LLPISYREDLYTRPGDLSGLVPSHDNLAYKVGKCLDRDGRYREVEILFKEIVEKKRKRLEDNDPSMLSSVADLASTCRYQGRWTEAEKISSTFIRFASRELLFMYYCPCTLCLDGILATEHVIDLGEVVSARY